MELFEAAFASVNIIPTALLVFVLIYWVAVILGLLDIDLFNLEIEVDTELDVDADGAGSVVWLNSVLAFFNLGRVPFMLFVTFVAVPFWVISILLNYYVTYSFPWVGFILLIPAFIGSLFVSKILTTPFVKMFAVLEKEHDSSVTIIGQMCTVTLPANSEELGQAAVKTAGAPLLLNVKTTQGKSLKKGQTALVIDYNQENKIYLIEPYETI
ncbi:MAG: YqiJ family protein [Hymenobacteraceae bacterium]|nr:YqiJ family protein [Hymenobacteraceae bacterium]MDX5395716.1 YqiJ family protein [Hymenobacteraceae bacterium]MDX5511768.1 YqiJ family protein [Hymenobacteraceae bacterium]